MKFMCPQAEGRVEMPWRKVMCPADSKRVPESGVRCAVSVLGSSAPKLAGRRWFEVRVAVSHSVPS